MQIYTYCVTMNAKVGVSIFLFFFLARSHPSASTWYKPVGVLNAHAFPASVKKMFLRLVRHQQEHSVRNLLQQLAEAEIILHSYKISFCFNS